MSQMTEPAQTGTGVPTNTAPATEGGIGELLKVIAQALGIALVVQTFLFQPFVIPSGSMIPTLLVGDYIFISKYSYGYSEYSIPFLPQIYKFVASYSFDMLNYTTPFDPHFFKGRFFAAMPKRGDVIVFKFPGDNATDYIKRLIGLPGDTVQMINGRLTINNVTVPRTPIASFTTTDAYGNVKPVPTYRETLPGGVNHVEIQLNGDTGMYANTQAFHVPANEYFMMGDNRDNSSDSRVPPSEDGVGFVPFDNLEGRAQIIWFSIRPQDSFFQFWKWPHSIRWSRLFTRIR